MTVQPSILGLRSVEMFARLNDSRLEELAPQFSWKRVVAGEHLLSRDGRDREVHLIIGGRVRVTVSTSAGRHITYKDLGPGSAVGVLSAIDGAGRSADVITLEDTLVASMSEALFHDLLRDLPTVADWLQKSLVGMVRELSDRVFEVSALGVQNRVHAELLRLARDAGVADNRATIDPAPTHVDIASCVSTYREQVTREISAMVKDGLVQRAGHALVVPDVLRLARIVAEVRRVS